MSVICIVTSNVCCVDEWGGTEAFDETSRGGADRKGMVSTCEDKTLSSEAFGETMSIADAGAGTGVDLSSEVLSTRDDAGGNRLVTGDAGGESNSEGDGAWFSGRRLGLGST